jgi:FtsP/CotA-like multicopper oxidase with cupredoxin domain
VAALLAPTPVGVGEREWRISLYRSRVPVGVVHLNARNFGEDGHDLSVRTRAGKVLKSIPELDPGDSGTLRVRLRKPGRYVVFCSLAGHEARGMRAVLRVKARAKR